MDKEIIKAFIRWLEDSGTTEQELLSRRDSFREALTKVTSPEAKADIKLGLRLLDEELLARMEIGRVGGKTPR